MDKDLLKKMGITGASTLSILSFVTYLHQDAMARMEKNASDIRSNTEKNIVLETKDAERDRRFLQYMSRIENKLDRMNDKIDRLNGRGP